MKYICTVLFPLSSTHFPENENDQLMEPKQSLNDFSSGIKCWPLFHKMKINIISHSDGFIKCEEGNEVIVIETPPHIR